MNWKAWAAEASLAKSVQCAAMCAAVLAQGAALGHYEKSVTTAKGQVWTIAYFEEDADGARVEVSKPSLDLVSARVCGASLPELSAAELWMPEHGHGSSPTSLSADEQDPSRCQMVNDLSFFMPGNWELRLQTAGGDSAVFRLHIHGGHDH